MAHTPSVPPDWHQAHPAAEPSSSPTAGTPPTVGTPATYGRSSAAPSVPVVGTAAIGTPPGAEAEAGGAHYSPPPWTAESQAPYGQSPPWKRPEAYLTRPASAEAQPPQWGAPPAGGVAQQPGGTAQWAAAHPGQPTLPQEQPPLPAWTRRPESEPPYPPEDRAAGPRPSRLANVREAWIAADDTAWPETAPAPAGPQPQNASGVAGRLAGGVAARFAEGAARLANEAGTGTGNATPAPAGMPYGSAARVARHRTGEWPTVGARTGRLDKNRWHWLLLVPIVLPLMPVIYNRTDPALFGMPFFYWCQLGFAFLASGVIAFVHMKVR